MANMRGWRRVRQKRRGRGGRDWTNRIILRGINKVMSRIVGIVEVVSIRIQSITATLRI